MLCFYITNNVYAQTTFSSDFEEQDHAWLTNNSSTLFEIISSEAKEGSQSARIQNATDKSYGVEHIITNISEQTFYDISAYIKIPHPPPSKAFIRIAWYTSTDGTGTQIETSDSPIISEKIDWTRVSISTQSPKDAHSAKIRLLISSGIAYFDTVSVQIFTPTPTAALSIQPTPTTTQPSSVIQNISISEVMVYPLTGEPEWVELYNDNDQEVTLEDWFIDDEQDGGASPKQFSITIPAFGYESLELPSAMFNNTGDSVRLLDLNKTEVDILTYLKSKKGYSLGKNASQEFCVQLPSQNKRNIGCFIQEETPNPENTKSPTPSNSIKDDIKGITTQITQKPAPRNLPTTPPFIAIGTTTMSEQITIVNDDTEKPIETKPLLLLSGSYSTLALISLVSKLIFFRYT